MLALLGELRVQAQKRPGICHLDLRFENSIEYLAGTRVSEVRTGSRNKEARRFKVQRKKKSRKRGERSEEGRRRELKGDQKT
jgi:hypothetical protein